MSWDAGLAAERTSLAWRRTGLSLFAVGLAIMRGIPTRAAIPGRPVVGAAVFLLGAFSFLLSSRQATVRARSVGTDRPSARLSDLAPMAAGTAFVGVAAFVIGVLH